MLNPDKLEKMIEEEECTAPRITKELIESRIDKVEYITTRIAGRKCMFCGIKMDNGFVVIGKPATCIDEENWRDNIAKEISYDKALSELWQLEAYRFISQ